MKIKLDINHEGKWQADVLLPDGRDFHAVGAEPWKALIELGIFWANQPKPSDTADIFRVLVETRK